MRAFDRDLIRGGHYGQRSCEPRKQAEHMAAPHRICDAKIFLANSEPSTHGPTPVVSLLCTDVDSNTMAVRTHATGASNHTTIVGSCGRKQEHIKPRR